MFKRDVYDEEHELFRNSIRRFLEAEAVPHHDAWEDAEITPRDFWLKAGEQGLLCPQIPEEYGGPGGDYRYLAVVQEEMALTGVTGPTVAVHSDICAQYILNHGTEAQKQKWLPKMVAGEAIAAIAMTEPGTGSDLQGVRTSAVKDGNGYRINGSKTFISNGQLADLVIVVAKTDPAAGARGTTLFLVDTTLPGFARGRNLDKLGLKAQDTSEMFFDDVKVSADDILGGEGMGFIRLMEELPQERLAVGVAAIASCQRAYDLAVAYAKERKAFGKPVIEFQALRHSLADVKADLVAGWALVDAAIKAHGRNELTADMASLVKLWTTEKQCQIVDKCLQVFGGYGYMLEYPIARMYRDARVQRIYGGTSEIMKEIIGRNL